MSQQVDCKPTFDELSTFIRKLYESLQRLHERADILQPDPLEKHEWFELLRQKLIPQLGASPWMVAAVVGGTNIGKSVTFNHLAGCHASASSPLASGTKHPVCLVPERFSGREDLQPVFPDFTLREWDEAESALEESDAHELFFRTAPELPNNLLVLDTPDIDSDARVNWVRADAVRRSADVLIAVLTQQKYNDAAVKEFFRKARAEDKAVLVVFNQCLLPDDEEYWPVWLDTFCRETGIEPDAVFLAPNDRRAANGLTLPFYARSWPSPSEAPDNTPRNLNEELANLRFREIRIRTLRGSLRTLLDEQTGLPEYLRSLGNSSSELAATAKRLSSDTVLRIRDWPSPPNSVFVDEIRIWWKAGQQGWAKRINSFYDTVGAGVLWPVKLARNAIQGEPVPPLDKYRDSEWSAILSTIEELFDKLQWMADTGNEMIRPRIEAVLAASSRSKLIAGLRERHAAIDFEAELKDTVKSEMETFSTDSPELFKLYKQLHNVSAAVRPVTSVVLFSLGMGPAGEAVAPIVANTAANMVVHVVTDVAGGAAAAAAGDTALASAAGTGSGMLQAWFHRLHSVFTSRRVDWLTTRIRDELLGTLPDDISAAASLESSDEWRELTTVIAELNERVRLLGSPALPADEIPDDQEASL